MASSRGGDVAVQQYLMYVMASRGTKVPGGCHPVAVVGRQIGTRAGMAVRRLDAQQEVLGQSAGEGHLFLWRGVVVGEEEEGGPVTV